jgi:hypothetical protein
VQHEVDKARASTSKLKFVFLLSGTAVLPKCMCQLRCSQGRLRRRICTLQLDSMLLAPIPAPCEGEGGEGACDVHSLNAIVILDMHVYLEAKQ